MDTTNTIICAAFEGSKLIANGALEEVAIKVKEIIDKGERESVLILDDRTSRPIEIDFRGTVEELKKRVANVASSEKRVVPMPPEREKPRGPGRPKLGVVAREVTLLPRHWEWLNAQPGGASVTLRKLVEKAKRENGGKDQLRTAQESAYRFMTTMAGNQAGYEDATRALFAGDREKFEGCIAGWPKDVREHSAKLAERVFDM